MLGGAATGRSTMVTFEQAATYARSSSTSTAFGKPGSGSSASTTGSATSVRSTIASPALPMATKARDDSSRTCSAGPLRDVWERMVGAVGSVTSTTSKPASPVLRGNLSTGNSKNYKVRLQGGHCYTIVSAGSPSVRNLDLVLVAPTGRELNRDQSKNSYPMVETDPCIRIAGEHTVRVYMYSGFGQFGLQLFTD